MLVWIYVFACGVLFTNTFIINFVVSQTLLCLKTKSQRHSKAQIVRRTQLLASGRPKCSLVVLVHVRVVFDTHTHCTCTHPHLQFTCACLALVAQHCCT